MDTDFLRELLVLEMKAAIKILEDKEIVLDTYSWNYSNRRAELQRRMKQIRQDTIKLEKIMYHKSNY